MAKAAKQPSFEEQMRQLEETITGLEAGDMPLDKAMETYRRGVELARALSAQLDEAAKQLKVLDGEEQPDAQ